MLWNVDSYLWDGWWEEVLASDVGGPQPHPQPCRYRCFPMHPPLPCLPNFADTGFESLNSKFCPWHLNRQKQEASSEVIKGTAFSPATIRSQRGTKSVPHKLIPVLLCTCSSNSWRTAPSRRCSGKEQGRHRMPYACWGSGSWGGRSLTDSMMWQSSLNTFILNWPGNLSDAWCLGVAKFCWRQRD